jgi:hypothetical protein
MGKVNRVKECVVPRSVQKEDGRRFNRFYVIVCTNAMQLQVQFIIYFLPVSSGFHFHTHAFRSLFCVFYALRTVHITPVMSHQYAPQHGYNAVAGRCDAGSHLLRRNRHPLSTKSVEKVGNCESRYLKSHGEAKVGYVRRCNAIATAIHSLLLSRLFGFPFSHACIPFTFPRFLCITHSAHHAHNVTPTRAATRI